MPCLVEYAFAYDLDLARIWRLQNIAKLVLSVNFSHDYKIYILSTGAVEAGGLSEANKAASGGECVGWLRLLLLFLFVMTARRNCSSYSVV